MCRATESLWVTNGLPERRLLCRAGSAERTLLMRSCQRLLRGSAISSRMAAGSNAGQQRGRASAYIAIAMSSLNLQLTGAAPGRAACGGADTHLLRFQAAILTTVKQWNRVPRPAALVGAAPPTTGAARVCALGSSVCRFIGHTFAIASLT